MGMHRNYGYGIVANQRVRFGVCALHRQKTGKRKDRRILYGGRRHELYIYRKMLRCDALHGLDQ